MTMHRSLIIASVGLSLLLFGAAAAIAASSTPITLDDAIRQALDNNPEIRQAVAARNEAHFGVQEKSSQRLPKISQVDQYVTSDDASTQLPDSNQINLQADETVFQGSLWSDLQRLRQTERGSEAELAQKRIEVALAVKESYFRVLSDSETLSIWNDAQREFSNVLRFVEPKFTVGAVPEFDYAKIRITIAQYQQSRLDTEKALSHELFILGEVMATDPPPGVEALPDVASPPSLDAGRVLDRAYPERPDLKAAAASADAGRFELQSAKRDYWPTAKVSADYGYTGQTWPDLSLGWGFSGILSLPVFDFGEIHSRVRQADARLQQQQLRVEALKLKVRTEINDQVQAVRTAWEKLRLIRQSLPEAQKAFENSVHRYRTSLAPMSELSDAHDLWVQTRIQQSEAILEYRMALAELTAAQGLLESPR